MLSDLFRKKSVAEILKEKQASEKSDNQSLKRTLGLRDLISFGIAAIIGAGIFSTVGKASADGGPAIVFLFMFTAIACSFTAFAYAEFSSMVPVSGSAYTYAYIAFGEVVAWIIGWALIMEYAVSNIVVAISWGDYFTNLMDNLHMPVPKWMTMDYLSAMNGFADATHLLRGGVPFEKLTPALQNAYHAWLGAPQLGAIKCVADVPALVIVVLITWLVYVGIKESKNASNLMVVVKLCVLFLIIGIGVFYIDPKNWIPFAPQGASGILKGVSAVFFAYIGFDALSTTAEECKDPQRDLPRGMMWSIIISTILYIAIALVLTGMVRYNFLGVGDPLSYVFTRLNIHWLSFIISVSAVVALSSALLVYQLGQPRIWMSMSRDGLLPKAFSRIHPKYKTPSYATVVTGFVVALPALFLNLSTVTDLTSIGTLFAFSLVCAGVMTLNHDPNAPDRKFKTPYLNAKYILPAATVILLAVAFIKYRSEAVHFIKNEPEPYPPYELLTGLRSDETLRLKNVAASQYAVQYKKAQKDLAETLIQLTDQQYYDALGRAAISPGHAFDSGWHLFSKKITLWIFFMGFIAVAVCAFRYNLSLIPVLGLLSCLYMMAQLALSNWLGFGAWLIIGLVIYFSYGYRNSRLRKENVNLS